MFFDYIVYIGDSSNRLAAVCMNHITEYTASDRMPFNVIPDYM